MENIIKTQSGYRATIDGMELFIPDAQGNRHWQMVQDAIAEGATVTVEEPPAPPVPNLSFPQLLIGLVTEGWITTEEGRAWRDRVALPKQVSDLISQMPAEQQFAVETRAFAPSEVLRTDPLVAAMGAAAGKTEVEMDDFFRKYAQI